MTENPEQSFILSEIGPCLLFPTLVFLSKDAMMLGKFIKITVLILAV